jgi:hypothetical protein
VLLVATVNMKVDVCELVYYNFSSTNGLADNTGHGFPGARSGFIIKSMTMKKKLILLYQDEY